MKKLVKPFNSEQELQLVDALCSEFGPCTNETCNSYRDAGCPSQWTCTGQSEDVEMDDDIIF